MRFTIFSFAALAVAAAAQLAPPSLNPPLSVVKKVDRSSHPPAPIEPATNAKRLAQGLPPKKPVRRHRGGPHVDGPYRDGTRVAGAPRAQTSPSVPVQQSCNILVTDSNGTPAGYIADDISSGYYKTFQAGQAGSLQVSFSYSDTTLSQRSLTVTNRPGAQHGHPYFGAIMSYYSTNNDLVPGSSNYAWIGDTDYTGSVPTVTGNSMQDAEGAEQASESPIWAYDPVTQGITARWINGNGQASPTYFVIIKGGSLALTGDVAATNARYGPVTELRFKCVPPQIAPARL